MGWKDSNGDVLLKGEKVLCRMRGAGFRKVRRN
jgi:hypothetical protein